MKFVEPIRDPKKISQIKNLLRGEGKIRDLLLFEFGINSGLRISDLLTVKVSDLFEENRTPRDFFDIKERKTSKMNRITITPKVKATLGEYVLKYPEILKNSENFIFFRQKSYPLGSDHIKKNMAGLLIADMAEAVGLKGGYSNHSLRKTWGFQARTNGIPLEIIQHKLNHSNLRATQHYLGITADEIADACNKLDL